MVTPSIRQDTRKEADVTAHPVATREEWKAAVQAVHEREQELGKLDEEIAKQRKELPWVKVEKQYTFDTEDGTRTLAELFEGRSELLAYHVMFGPEWTAACPGCTSLADHFNPTLPHLNDRDVTMICMSHAPIDKLAAHKRERGWTFPYVSTYNSDFGYDFHLSFSPEQRSEGAEYNFEKVDFDEVLAGFDGDEYMAEIAASLGTDVAGYVTTEGPGFLAFALRDGVVHHTYTAYAPELNVLVFSQQLLERAPTGGSDSS
jgi:predicted dithiol-disulfide oxidoreductase (DUF899 family)